MTKLIDCKPCITIRTILKLIWLNYVVNATKTFKEDYKSYSRVNATSCVLEKVKEYPMTTEHHMKAAARIRDLYKDDQ